MTLGTAVALWGSDVVRRALAEPDADPPSTELVQDVNTPATDPPNFARWALTLPWSRFCTVVHIVAGETTHDLMTEDDDD